MIEPLVVARIGADHQAERTRRERDGNANAKRHARAHDDAGKQVAPKVIAAKGMRGRRCRKSQRHLLRIGINRPHQRTDERDQRNRQENAAADHKPLVGKSLLNVCHHASPHLRARGSKSAVGKVDDQIDHRIQQGDDQQHALNHRIVATLDRLVTSWPKPGMLKMASVTTAPVIRAPKE